MNAQHVKAYLFASMRSTWESLVSNARHEQTTLEVWLRKTCLCGTFSPLALLVRKRKHQWMPITEEELREFTQLYEQEFGKQLSREAGLEMATRLLSLFQLIMRPLAPEIEKEIKRRCEEALRCESALQDA